jgi:hypothetical protein
MLIARQLLDANFAHGFSSAAPTGVAGIGNAGQCCWAMATT